ncbi:MAG: hypothetical protein WAU07_00730 [Microgenomates group bacterium]
MNDQSAQPTPFQSQPTQPSQQFPPKSVPSPMQNHQDDSLPSYVDAYNPPTSSNPLKPEPLMQATPQMQDAPQMQNSPRGASMSSPSASGMDSSSSEELQDQNIFDLLGVKDGSPEQREQFLDELQQVIWEDFLENDARLLLTEDEMSQLKVILEKSTDNSLEQQEEVVVFLEKLIPDLEDIMLEKALDLKADLFKERIIGTREYIAADPSKLHIVDQAEQQMQQNKWHTASKTLDTIKM